MGKDSKHQRTKGGVQPSNASRAAKLLEKTSSSSSAASATATGVVNSFLAASAEVRNEYSSYSLLESPVHSSLLVDDELPPEVRLVFRKLLKKDGTTKIKALSELTQLIDPQVLSTTTTTDQESTAPQSQQQQSNTTAVQQQQDVSNVILPQWTKLYPKLTQDESRKVRELAQSTHTIVCKAVGRSLAKHLRQLMPYWLISQFDLYSPVASAAKRSFCTVFPTESKRVDSLKYCSAEIHAYLKGNFEGPWRNGKVDDEGDIRVVVGSIWCLAELIKLGIVENSLLEELFGGSHSNNKRGGGGGGGEGTYWAGIDCWGTCSLVNKPALDLLTTTLLHQPQTPVSSKKIVKLLLTTPHPPETFPNAFNLVEVACQRQLITPPQAKSLLLAAASSSFHHSSSLINIIPVFQYVYQQEEQQQQQPEFLQKFLQSVTKGLDEEKSLNERISVVRQLIRLLNVVQHDEAQLNLLFEFFAQNIQTCSSSDLPSCIVSSVVEQHRDRCFAKFWELARCNGKLDTKEFGAFVAGLVVVVQNVVVEQQQRNNVGRRVMFAEEHEDAGGALNDAQSRDGGGDIEQHPNVGLVYDAVRYCVEHRAYVPVTILSRKLGPMIWKNVQPDSVELENNDDHNLDDNLKLKIVVDMISVWDESPRLLAILSTLLDKHDEHSNPHLLCQFISELTPYLHITPIRKWVSMQGFLEKLETLVSSIQTQSQLNTTLNFIEKLNNGSSTHNNLVQTLVSRLQNDAEFSTTLANTLLNRRPNNYLFTPVYECYLHKYVESLVNEQIDSLSEAVVNKVRLSADIICPKLDSSLGECRTVASLDNLVSLAGRIVVVEPDGVGGKFDWITIPSIRVSSGVMSFLQFSYSVHAGLNGPLETVHEFGEMERLLVVKSLAYGKMGGSSNNLLLVDRVCKLMYAQAICDIWSRLASVSGQSCSVPPEILEDLRVTWCRLLERCYNTELWSNVCQQLLQNPSSSSTSSQDIVWESGLPYRIFASHCVKSEMSLKTQVSHVDFESFEPAQIDNVLEQLRYGGLRDVETCATWLIALRKHSHELFSFDVLYRNIEDYVTAAKLLLITSHLLERSDDETTLSTLCCWIASWVVGLKYVESTRAWLYWTGMVGNAVKIIGRRGRETNMGQFVYEYVEFHAGQVYPGVYRLFIELSKHNNHPNNALGWWGLHCLTQVGSGLACVPANNLVAIEPDCMKIIDTFMSSLLSIHHSRTNVTTTKLPSLPVRIAAYRVVRKVRYGKDLPIVPPSMDLRIRKLAAAFDNAEDPDHYVTYLLVWDALLRIQEGSNEFASYVRDQDHLLRLLLDSLFFSLLSNIDAAMPKHFDTMPQLEPLQPVSILHLSCSVLLRALRNLPYTVRWWWNNHVTKQRDRVFVEKFVVKHLSSRLAAEELKNAQVRDEERLDNDDEDGLPPSGACSGFAQGNVTVHCHSGCNELVAHYRIEETNVTLTISLPLNHPLGPVTVRISDKKLHAKISHLLNTRSHSLSAGLKLWKETLDSLYKDVDECAICFFILHHVTKQTPKLGCKTCKKKFHAACLYKWFSTSNKSECPLCRNLF